MSSYRYKDESEAFYVLAFVLVVVLFILLLAMLTSGKNTKEYEILLPQKEVVAVTGDNLDDLQFYCKFGSKIYECDEKGLGRELVLKEGEELVAATKLADETIFFCLTDGKVIRCVPQTLVPVK